MASETIATLEFTTGELRALPAEHGAFFVTSCLAINEISLLQKVLLMALNGSKAAKASGNSDVVRAIAFSSGVVAQRNLSAKLVEYLRMLGDYLKKAQRSKGLALTQFRNDARTKLDEILATDGYKRAIWYRDNVTNHYLVSELAKFIETANLGADDQPHPLYLHNLDGNSFYLLGEQVLLGKLLEGGGKAQATLAAQDKWVLGVSKRITRIHTDFCIALTEAFFAEKVAIRSRVELNDTLVGSLPDASLPVFWKLPADEPNRLTNKRSKSANLSRGAGEGDHA